MKTGTITLMRGSVLDGKRFSVVRKLNSGYLTVKLLEDVGAYRKGDEITLGCGEWRLDL